MTQGGSLMVSDYACAWHGLLRVSSEVTEAKSIPELAREIIKPGVNADGYWKSEDMVRQLREKALPFLTLYIQTALVFLRLNNQPALMPTHQTPFWPHE